MTLKSMKIWKEVKKICKNFEILMQFFERPKWITLNVTIYNLNA